MQLIRQNCSIVYPGQYCTTRLRWERVLTWRVAQVTQAALENGSFSYQHKGQFFNPLCSNLRDALLVIATLAIAGFCWLGVLVSLKSRGN